MNLQDKVVVVTGAARGIGAEYCLSLQKLGAKVIAGDIADFPDGLDSDSLMCGNLDVTSSESVANLVTAGLARFGRMDGLINNAALYGTLKGGRFTDIEEDEWDAAMRVNVKGIWNCCSAVLEPMREAGGGSIVNISSVAALYGTPFALHYAASKGAVIGLTRALAREIGRYNIRVNVIAPTAVATEGTREFLGSKTQAALDIVTAGQAIPRALTPGDITGTANWLISDSSAFVTGQTIPVDGGTVMT